MKCRVKSNMAAVIFLAVLFLLGSTVAVNATLLGPTYPAPGGTTWSGSGVSPGTAGGATWSYSGFDMTLFDELYWGPGSADSFGLSLDGNINSTDESLDFQSIVVDTATWSGSSTLYWFHNSGWYYNQISTKLKITATGNASWVGASTADSSLSSLGALLEIQGDYSINFLFEAFMPDNNGGWSWLPVLDGFNNLNTNQNESVISSFSGGFYYELAPEEPPVPGAVPEPTTMLLFGFGLLGLAGVSRKKLQQ